MSTGGEGAANLQVVDRFVATFNENDLEGVMSFFTDDCVYHNIPMDKCEGIDAIRAVLSGFGAMASEAEWITHFIAEDANGAVLTERTDRFHVGEKWMEIRVMGTFELRDGKICAWRDYFDLAMMQSQMAP